MDTRWNHKWVAIDRTLFDGVFDGLADRGMTSDDKIARALTEKAGKHISGASVTRHRRSRVVPFEWAVVYAEVDKDRRVIAFLCPWAERVLK